ncbi:tRNA-splicing endonuclease subunit [Friedmanniomyces endolithicus]|uniref:tRNA-intron lyase n=1 Tax=Friedmanniomyces endolithicus TaxID=329885 RepID=A0AAN6J6U9_9PEZI|nr:tRNA-splicing endonuclease subunit [Friedmanniomyces endolithicus]KAK0290049.1 tRNA-splicing endonuclease subunit [Friedmanniomyces endolithicus]KAK0318445.1 tRNA-splicing endonuclease subunit [Friedmanniomyces endolithicus]KAK1017202.1 tRNA-splicing endonuclease subunit [Friedmanniomyces endolithicus]
MATAELPTVTEPFPIFTLALRYLLYDIATISHIRAHHNIPGVLIGLLPQAPQQNVFSGIPLELMPEEACLLCERGAAYIVDDVRAHKQGFLDRQMGEEERRLFREGLRRQGVAAARQVSEKSEGRKLAAMQRRVESGASVENWNDLPEDMLRPASRAGKSKRGKKGQKQDSGLATPAAGENGEVAKLSASDTANSHGANLHTSVDGGEGEEESLFGPPTNSFPANPLTIQTRTTSTARRKDPEPYGITPATSYPPLVATPPPPRSNPATPTHPSRDPAEDVHQLPDVPLSYPLYRYLHSKGYFLMPGLRFGCQYTAYPGDPLRFHSHFLCSGMGWDEEFDLLDLVTGGRMGTGVKKGYLLGGISKAGSKAGGRRGRVRYSEEEGIGIDGGEEEVVRTFCIEWGGM